MSSTKHTTYTLLIHNLNLKTHQARPTSNLKRFPYLQQVITHLGRPAHCSTTYDDIRRSAPITLEWFILSTRAWPEPGRGRNVSARETSDFDYNKEINGGVCRSLDSWRNVSYMYLWTLVFVHLRFFREDDATFFSRRKGTFSILARTCHCLPSLEWSSQ